MTKAKLFSLSHEALRMNFCVCETCVIKLCIMLYWLEISLQNTVLHLILLQAYMKQ